MKQKLAHHLGQIDASQVASRATLEAPSAATRVDHLSTAPLTLPPSEEASRGQQRWGIPSSCPFCVFYPQSFLPSLRSGWSVHRPWRSAVELWPRSSTVKHRPMTRRRLMDSVLCWVRHQDEIWSRVKHNPVGSISSRCDLIPWTKTWCDSRSVTSVMDATTPLPCCGVGCGSPLVVVAPILALCGGVPGFDRGIWPHLLAKYTAPSAASAMATRMSGCYFHRTVCMANQQEMVSAVPPWWRKIPGPDASAKPNLELRDRSLRLQCRHACPNQLHLIWSDGSCSRGFRQRSPLGDLCLEIDGSGGSWSCTPMFLWLFGFRGSILKICRLLITWNMLSRSMGLAENVIEGEICGLAMVVSIFVAMRNWLGVPWLGAVVCKWGRLHMISPKSYLSGWKSKVWP
jgi:hypothetical protein